MSQSTNSLNVYDFDHTIYHGDASLGFILYCMRRRPSTWKRLPAQGLVLMRYIFGTKSRKEVKQIAFAFLNDIKDVDKLLNDFWETHERKIKPWYLAQKKDSDVVISASPEFLLTPIIQKLGIGTLIGTRMDPKTGKITGENCRGEEKAKRLYAHDSSIVIDNCYSDSLSDQFLFNIAKTPYIINKHAVILLAEHRPSKLSSFKNAEFIRFLFVGGVSAFLGIFFAYGISFFIDKAIVAWIVGYLLSLLVSYPLNAMITFNHFELSWRQFGSFCISYIPNFAIQFIAVFVLVGYFEIYRLFAYILAVIIAVPITFLLLAGRTFNKQAS